MKSSLLDILSLLCKQYLVMRQLTRISLICSEWVLGNREDLAKDIIAELEPENGEVIVLTSYVDVAFSIT